MDGISNVALNSVGGDAIGLSDSTRFQGWGWNGSRWGFGIARESLLFAADVQAIRGFLAADVAIGEHLLEPMHFANAPKVELYSKAGYSGHVYASYRNFGLSYAAQEVANLLARVMYPIPGIWMGPAFVHMPSGNVVLQLAVPPAGLYDPIPVFTYNSQAGKAEAGRGYGISDLFNPTIQPAAGGVSLVDGTGKALMYKDVGVDTWGTAPASARNGLKIAYDLTWVERQPDGLKWIYHPAGYAQKIISPSGDNWIINRNSDCLVSSIVNPLSHRTTFIWEDIGDSRLQAIVDAESNRTTLSYVALFDGTRALHSIERPIIGTLEFGYGGNGRCSSITDYDGNATQLGWNSDENCTSVQDAASHSFGFEYNGPSAGHRRR